MVIANGTYWSINNISKKTFCTLSEKFWDFVKNIAANSQKSSTPEMFVVLVWKRLQMIDAKVTVCFGNPMFVEKK